MSTTAIVMMIVALTTVWGGLALSLLHLRRHPDDEEPLVRGEVPGRADADGDIQRDR